MKGLGVLDIGLLVPTALTSPVLFYGIHVDAGNVHCPRKRSLPQDNPGHKPELIKNCTSHINNKSNITIKLQLHVRPVQVMDTDQIEISG